MAKPKWKTQYNADQYPQHYEVFKLPSVTVPDQSLTLPEIVSRHARKMPVVGTSYPVYEGEESTQTEFMTKIDLEIARREFAIELEDIQKRQKERMKKVKENFQKQVEKAAKEAAAKQKEADQGSNVQRTTGEGSSSTDR